MLCLVPMEPVIRSLTLKGFRSIAAERIEFDNPTFLVGENGAGKSNLVDALSFLAEAMASPLQAVLQKRGGISSVLHRGSSSSTLGLSVKLGRLGDSICEGSYGFAIAAHPDQAFEVVREECHIIGPDGQHYSFERTGSRLVSNIGGLQPLLNPSSLGLPVIGGIEQFYPVLRTLAGMRVYSIEASKIREMKEPNGGSDLRHDGQNTAGVLYEISRHSPEELEQISELLAVVVPHGTRVKPVKRGPETALEFTEEWTERQRVTFDASAMSGGTLRTLGLLTAVFQHPTPPLIVLEDPETELHPGSLGVILDLIQIAAGRSQVLVTTHSPDLLDAKWVKPHHIRVITWERGGTRAALLSEGSQRVLQQHLAGVGELLRTNSLDATLGDADPEAAALFSRIE